MNTRANAAVNATAKSTVTACEGGVPPTIVGATQTVVPLPLSDIFHTSTVSWSSRIPAGAFCAAIVEPQRQVRSALTQLAVSVANATSLAAIDDALSNARVALSNCERPDVLNALDALRGALVAPMSTDMVGIVAAHVDTGPLDFARAELKAIAHTIVSQQIIFAEPQEDVASFLRGALFGETHTWAGTGGAMALGFVPVLGQLADVRDIVKALRHWGPDGAGLELAAAAIGVIPGADFLKAGRSAASREVLQQAADQLNSVSVRGLKTIEQRLGTEVAAKVEARVRLINVVRAELTARIDVVLGGNVPPPVRKALAKLRNAVTDHAAPNDVVGAFRDVHGLPVRNPQGGFFDHEKEVGDVVKSLRNAHAPFPWLDKQVNYYLMEPLMALDKLLSRVRPQ